jgi:hypothetical protein
MIRQEYIRIGAMKSNWARKVQQTIELIDGEKTA